MPLALEARTEIENQLHLHQKQAKSRGRCPPTGKGCIEDCTGRDSSPGDVLGYVAKIVRLLHRTPSQAFRPLRRHGLGGRYSGNRRYDHTGPWQDGLCGDNFQDRTRFWLVLREQSSAALLIGRFVPTKCRSCVGTCSSSYHDTKKKARIELVQGSSNTFVTPSSRLSNRSYISGASSSSTRCETTKLGSARP